jgi:hypothetical protein
VHRNSVVIQTGTPMYMEVCRMSFITFGQEHSAPAKLYYEDSRSISASGARRDFLRPARLERCKPPCFSSQVIESFPMTVEALGDQVSRQRGITTTHSLLTSMSSWRLWISATAF